jgi:hypothetical protein
MTGELKEPDNPNNYVILSADVYDSDICIASGNFAHSIITIDGGLTWNVLVTSR